MIKFKNILLCAIIFSSFLTLIIFNKTVVEGALDGMVICAQRIIPSLFPFTVVAVFLYNGRYIDSLTPKSEAGQKFIIFIISCLGGFPIGAKIISEAYNGGRISRTTAENMLCCAINAGPAFCVSVVGVIYYSNQIGIIIFISSIISALQIYFIFNKKSELPQTKSRSTVSFTENFVYSVSSAAAAMLSVCAYIVIFSSIINLVDTYFTDNVFKNVLLGTLEVTTAVANSKSVYLSCFFIGFSGISIIMQVISLTKCFKPNIIKIIISRILNGLLLTFNAFLLIKIFKIKLDVISNGYLAMPLLSQGNVAFSILFLITCACLIYCIRDKKYSGKLRKDIF